MIEILRNLFKKKSKDETKTKFEVAKPKVVKSVDLQSYFDRLEEATLKIEIGSDLAPYCEEYILSGITELRERIMEDTGFIIPLVRIKSNNELQENQYVIYVRNKAVYEDFIIPSSLKDNEEIQLKLGEICFKYIDDVFNDEILEMYINKLRDRHLTLIYNLTYRLTNYNLRHILIELIKNNISLQQIDYIFEKIDKVVSLDDYLYEYPDRLAEALIAELKKNQ